MWLWLWSGHNNNKNLILIILENESINNQWMIHKDNWIRNLSNKFKHRIRKNANMNSASDSAWSGARYFLTCCRISSRIATSSQGSMSGSYGVHSSLGSKSMTVIERTSLIDTCLSGLSDTNEIKQVLHWETRQTKAAKAWRGPACSSIPRGHTPPLPQQHFCAFLQSLSQSLTHSDHYSTVLSCRVSQSRN